MEAMPLLEHTPEDRINLKVQPIKLTIFEK